MARPKKNIQRTKRVVKSKALKAKVSEPVFKLILQANNCQYTGAGDTVLGAVDSLGLHAIDLNTEGTIFIEKSGVICERYFILRMLRRVIEPLCLYREAFEQEIEEYFKQHGV